MILRPFVSLICSILFVQNIQAGLLAPDDPEIINISKTVLLSITKELINSNTNYFKDLDINKIDSEIRLLRRDSSYLVAWKYKRGVQTRPFSVDELQSRKYQLDGKWVISPLASQTTYPQDGIELTLFVNYLYPLVPRSRFMKLDILCKNLETGYFLDGPEDLSKIQKSLSSIYIKAWSDSFTKFNLDSQTKPKFAD
ncbi:MAG: hypothetical protein HC904_08195 [Blastochloris sp.]|nr:hypothetical protein [Blastochloris sp.]